MIVTLAFKRANPGQSRRTNGDGSPCSEKRERMSLGSGPPVPGFQKDLYPLSTGTAHVPFAWIVVG
jgi:hypothetical protein